MIGITNFALFVTASWALILLPGPDMLYVITRGIAQGPKAGLLSAMGITLGILVHTVFAALGLAVLLQTSAPAFFIMKTFGAIYLVYLGFKAFRDNSGFTLHTQQITASFRTIFWQGALSNLLNPKIALFYLAFLPQFVNREGGNVPIQMALLGLLFALFGVAFLSVVGYFAGEIGRWLSSSPYVTGKLRWLAGSLFIGLGVRLAFVER
jgi:threonine/homoserine/homoserine lactone efflux protein